MTTRDDTISTGADLADVEARLAAMLGGVDWLDEADAHRARHALAALVADIRANTAAAGPGDVFVSTTATSTRLTVILEASGAAFGAAAAGRPSLVEQAFHEVTCARVLGRTRWILRRFAARPRLRSEGDRDRHFLGAAHEGQRELVAAAEGAQH